MPTWNDVRGPTTTYVYDADARILEEVRVYDGVTRWEYDEVAKTIRRIAPDGAACTWLFEALPRPGAAAAAGDGAAGDESGALPLDFAEPGYRIVAFLDAQGGKTTYQYDSQDGQIRVTDPAGQATLYTDRPGYRLVPRVDARTGRVEHRFQREPFVSALRYDRDARTPADHKRAEVTETFEYDGEHSLIGAWAALEPAPRSRVTVDAEITIRETGADGAACAWVFALPGCVGCLPDERTGRPLVAAAFGRFVLTDPRCRLLAFVDPKGGRTTYDDDPSGAEVRVTDPWLRTKTFVARRDHRVWPVFDPATGQVAHVYQRHGSADGDAGEPAQEAPAR